MAQLSYRSVSVPAIRLPLPRACAAVLAMAVGLLAVGCIDQQGLPPDCAEGSVTRDATLTATTMTPNGIEVCRGQEVFLTIDAEVDGVFHLHGYDDAVPATSVRIGDELNLEFDALRSGQFPIELHPADDPTGVTVGIFTVHER